MEKKIQPGTRRLLRMLMVMGPTLFTAPVFANAAATDQSAGQLKKLSLEELMDVEVTSVSRRPEKITTVASAIQVITRDDIQHSGASSIPEALRLAPNLQVARVNSSQWAISARGFDNVLANKLLVMIDGRTVYTPLYAGVFWDAQDTLLEDIDRIEVVSGPGGTLWGANAVNGVINITTRSASKTQGLFVSGGAGDELRNFGELRYGGELAPNVYYRVYGKSSSRDDTALLNGTSSHDAWHTKQGGFRLDAEMQNDTFTLQSDIYGDKPNPDGTVPVDASGDNVLGRWKHTTSKDADFQLQFYYDKTRRDFGNGFVENLETYDLDWQNRFLYNHYQEVVWGVGARLLDHQVDNLTLFKFLPAHQHLHRYSAFIQDEIRLLDDHLRLTLGTKLERNDYTGLEFQPNIRLAWSPVEQQTLWAAISRAVRTPARIDRDFYLSASPTIPVIQGANFQSEHLLAYELGWRAMPKDDLSLSLSTFFNDYDDIRSAEPGPSILNLPITFGNGVMGQTYGVEFATTYALTTQWRLKGGYTFLKKHLAVKPGSRDLNQASAESDDPEHQLLVQSILELPYRLQLDTVIRYVDELPQPHVGSHTDIDIRFAWSATNNVELAIVGQSLLDTRHQEFVPSSPSPRDIERSIYGKITWRL